MEVMQVLHMNKGDGETSYARNSTVQSKTISITKPIIQQAVLQILEDPSIESMGIADLGCSSGPNTFLVISQIMDVIHARLISGLDRPSPVTELRVYLNDLFSNDFNSIFMSLPTFYNKLKHSLDPRPHIIPPFISAVPGSFHGPLFPKKSLHFVHSSFSLMWLSQAPDGLNNKGKIYVSKSSPQCVWDAYSMQFQKDFSDFLSSRAQEIVEGGRMVLSFIGRPSYDPTGEGNIYHFELLAHALMAMVSKGVIKEEQIDSFNLPVYASSAEEVNLVLQKQGSFIKDSFDTFELDSDIGGNDLDQDESTAFDDDQTITSSGRRVANSIRVVTESMLVSHFGKEIMDELYHGYAEIVSKHLSNSSTRPKYTIFVVSLIRRPELNLI